MARVTKDAMRQAGSLDKFFSEAQKSSEDASEVKAEEKSSKDKEEAQKDAEESQKKKKKSFSFRADPEKVDSWRVYAIAKGLKVDDLGEKALQEYVKRHKLNEAEQAVYDLKLSQRKS